MHLRRIDLNLLLVFDAIMRTGNVSRAALKLGMSQPAVSKALGRLRHVLKDELFIRAPDGMQATPRARELSAPVRQALSSLEHALDPSQFNPATAQRTFHIATNDYVASVFMPKLTRYLREHAPGVDLRLYPNVGKSLDMLDQQEADFAIMPYEILPERFEYVDVMNAPFVVIMRQGHPLSDGEITLERYAQADHLMVTFRGDDRSFVDDKLERRGLRRRVAMTINQFNVGPPIVAASDMIMSIPRPIAEQQASFYDLIVREAPDLGLPFGAALKLVWSRRLTRHPAHDWMKDVLINLSRK